MNAATREQVVRDYMAGLPVREIAARHGISAGYVPMIARQAGLPPRKRCRRSRDLLEDVEWLVADGATLTAVCDRLDIKPDTLWKACKRHGRLDLFDRLADREPNGELRRITREARRRPAREVA